MDSIFEREAESMFQVYKRFHIEAVKAEGARIISSEGDEYLDFLAGIAVNALGHCHPAVVEAVCEQAKKFMHISNYFYQEPQVKLAEKLKTISGFDKVFFSNSGTEANEGAIKLARRYGHDLGKTEIIGFSGGFHGRTYGALSVMDKPHYKDKMGPFLSDCRVIKYNDCDELKNTISDKTAAIILEFIQGEGGISSVTPEFISTINVLRDKYGFLVIADEVQAGTGRTGKFFAFEHWGFKPDIITLAKGMGGGMPLGALIANDKLAAVWERGMHGTTYGGNPVACAAGYATINEIEKYALNNTIVVGEYFITKLKALAAEYTKLIKEVRGKGLMLGLELSFDASILVGELLKRYAVSNAASGSVLRIVPPMIINKLDVDEFIGKLSGALEFINTNK
jgi:acetylornithine/N-succinyldiaminopimelate aminotransferase